VTDASTSRAPPSRTHARRAFRHIATLASLGLFAGGLLLLQLDPRERRRLIERLVSPFTRVVVIAVHPELLLAASGGIATPDRKSTANKGDDMTEIKRTIEIGARPDAVFNLLTDLDRLPDWSTITVTTHDTPDKPLQAGQTFQQTLRVLGRSLDTEWHVDDIAPNRVAYSATAPGGGRLRMAQTVEGAGDGSRVEFELDYDLPGAFLGQLLDTGYVARRNEREVEHSLHNLKELLESSAQG
jgi:uncharacterized membrane protein